MSDEINEFLGIDVEKLNASPNSSHSATTKSIATQESTAETILKTLANIFLIFGIIGSIGIAYFLESQFDLGFVSFIFFLSGTVSSLVTWALMMVIASMSTAIRSINQKIQ